MSSRFEGILLAAGESRRMGYPKPLLRVGERTFIELLATRMLTAVERLVIVLGAHREQIRPAIPVDQRIAVVENAAFAQGQLSSLKVGLAALSAGTDAALVHLADHPLVQAATFQGIVAHCRQSVRAITITRYNGHRGHPVVFARAVFGELMAAPLNEGARVVVNVEPGRVEYFDVDDGGILADLDTPGELKRVGLKIPLKAHKAPR